MILKLVLLDIISTSPLHSSNRLFAMVVLLGDIDVKLLPN